MQTLREAQAPSLAPSDNVPLLGTQTPPNVVLRDDESRGPRHCLKEGWIALCAGNCQAQRPPSRPWALAVDRLLHYRDTTTDSEPLDVEENDIFIPLGPTISTLGQVQERTWGASRTHSAIATEAVQSPTERRVATNQNWWPGRPGETSSPQQHQLQVVAETAVLWRGLVLLCALLPHHPHLHPGEETMPISNFIIKAS